MSSLLMMFMTKYESGLVPSRTPTIESQTPTETSSALTNLDASAVPYNVWNFNTEGQDTASTSASASERAASNTPSNTETKTSNEVLPLLPQPTTRDSSELTIFTTLSSTSTTTAGTATSTTTHAPNSEPSPEPSSAESSYSGGNDSTKTKLAISLPISIVGLLIIALVWFYLRRRRRQRHAQPTFDMATNKATAASASEFMVVPKVATPEPAVSSRPHTPVRDVHVHRRQSRESSPGPDANTELGIAVAVPMNRMSATEYDLRGLGRSNSRIGAGALGIRLPFQDDDGDDDEEGEDKDAVSVVSV